LVLTLVSALFPYTTLFRSCVVTACFGYFHGAVCWDEAYARCGLHVCSCIFQVIEYTSLFREYSRSSPELAKGALVMMTPHFEVGSCRCMVQDSNGPCHL